MSRISLLFDLQQIDSALDKFGARLKQLESQMVDSPELIAARADHEQSVQEHATRHAELKQLSHETEEVSSRLKLQEKRLYDGTIKNPKELGQVQEEAWHLKARFKTLEDAMLDKMMQTEESEATVNEKASQLDLVTKEWEQFQAGLMEEKDLLDEQVKALRVKRHRAASEVPAGDLQVYETLRRTKRGVAVAAVHNGLCGGCHTGVPAHVLRVARTSNDFTMCPSCARILYPVDQVKFKEFDHDLDNVAR